LSEVASIKDFLPTISMIIGSVLAIAVGFFSTLFFERRRDKRVQRALVLAFRGEISALLNIVERRGYIRDLQGVISGMKESGVVQKFFFTAKRDYFTVFETNAGSIGLLPSPMPEDVACFYTYAKSILEDMGQIEAGPDDWDLNEAIEMHKELLSVLQEAVKVGEKIVDESRKYC